jgi:cell division protein FtsN
MGRDNGNKSSSPRKSGDSLWTGLLVGILVGVCMAVGVAWYRMKLPSPFVNKEQPVLAKPVVPAAKEKPAATPGDGKPRFEFYKVLTDKQGENIVVPVKPDDKSRPAKPQPGNGKPAAVYEAQILQAGSFSNVGEAENLKAKLALLGVEANIQTATIPDKGVWYRVRLGPYKSADEMNHARGFLKQNGVDSTPMRAQ